MDSRDQRLEHRLLAFEVEIDRALGDAGARGDVVHARGGEALFGEQASAASRISGGRASLRRFQRWAVSSHCLN